MPKIQVLKNTILLLGILVLAFFAPLPVQLSAQDMPENDQTVYVIRNIDFNVTGRSKPFALMRHGEFRTGERIQGRENFDRYLALRTQFLNNQRVLENRTRIEYFLGDAEPDGALPVRLLVHVRDSRNFIVLPDPRYSSNDGLVITLRARDYNFLGTMTPLRFDMSYRRSINDENIFGFILDLNTPFQYAGYNWNLRFEHQLSYDPDKPLRYTGIAGLSLDLPWHNSTFTVGFNQFLFINEETSSDSKNYYGVTRLNYDPYNATEIFGAWNLPLGIEVGQFGWLHYTFFTAVRVNYPTIDTDLVKRPVFTMRNTIGFGRINWIGNFRKGLSAYTSLSHDFYYDNPDTPTRSFLDSNLIFHQPIFRYLSFSSRLRYRQWWRWSNRYDVWLAHDNAGDMLRGVINDHLHAHRMLSLSLDFPIYLMRFWPSEWLNNRRLSFFNVEVHAAPFTDLALLAGPRSRLFPDDDGVKFSLDNMVQTVGLEVIVYSGFYRNLHLRGSIGYNLDKIRANGLDFRWGFFPNWHEIFIGIELEY